ncbi:TPA: hypothetical protein N0F65_003960 [Lagenidium giganteum]|uniref:Protein kinase domain-containing protein n=1 Tax=Lagenidium giganteum TaxID=4803 RepID=A0AAV2YRL2_9STRA|nr:TPA: hypothetical protein N0F65_003960 [Lagenidium giganteum]
MSRILSRNYSAEVFLGEYNSQEVVIKRLLTMRFQIRELVNAMREVELMSGLSHVAIVQYMGSMWADPEYLCVVCEHVEGGDLRSLLEMESSKNNCPLAMGDVASSAPRLRWFPTKIDMLLSAADGLMYVHEMGIVHRDLRSRNVLVTSSFACKLNDFRRRRNEKYFVVAVSLPSHLGGTASTIGEDQVARVSTVDTTAAVMLPLVAPEILYSGCRYQPSADIYSVGLLLIEMCCQRRVMFTNINPFTTDYDDDAAEDHEQRRRQRRRKKTLSFSVLSSSSEPDDDEDSEIDDGGQGREHDEMLRAFMESLRHFTRVESDYVYASDQATRSRIEMVLDLTHDCLKRDPKKRPTAKVLMQRLRQIRDYVAE